MQDDLIDEKLDVLNRWWNKVFAHYICSLPDVGSYLDKHCHNQEEYTNCRVLMFLTYRNAMYKFEEDCEDSTKMCIMSYSSAGVALYRVATGSKVETLAKLTDIMNTCHHVFTDKSLPTLDEMKVQLMLAGQNAY